MKTLFTLLLAAIVLLSLAGCAAGPNEFVDTPNAEGQVAGFLYGLWHGVIAPVTFVISLFSDSVHPYEIHNNGGWYNSGFLLGLSIVFGGSGGGAAKSRCSKR